MHSSGCVFALEVPEDLLNHEKVKKDSRKRKHPVAVFSSALLMVSSLKQRTADTAATPVGTLDRTVHLLQQRAHAFSGENPSQTRIGIASL